MVAMPPAVAVGCAALLPPHATPNGTTAIAPSAPIDQLRIILRDAFAWTRFSFIGKVSSDLFTTYG
jgi:hypothetical protein